MQVTIHWHKVVDNVPFVKQEFNAFVTKTFSFPPKTFKNSELMPSILGDILFFIFAVDKLFGLHNICSHLLGSLKITFLSFLAAIFYYCVKSFSHPFLVGTWDFYVKCKNVKISQKQSHLALFRESIFLPFFVGRLIFCKNGKYVKEYVRKLWTAKLFLFTNLNIPVS